MNTLHTASGALAILADRVAVVGVPGVGLWARVGSEAVAGASRTIVNHAHQNECAERGLVEELADILADGVVDPAELKRLASAKQTLKRCAERSHDITEIAAT